MSGYHQHGTGRTLAPQLPTSTPSAPTQATAIRPHVLGVAASPTAVIIRRSPQQPLPYGHWWLAVYPPRSQCRRVRVTELESFTHGQMTVVAQPDQQRLYTHAQVLPRHQARRPLSGVNLTTVGTLTAMSLVFHNFNSPLHQLSHLLHLHRHWLRVKLKASTMGTDLGRHNLVTIHSPEANACFSYMSRGVSA